MAGRPSHNPSAKRAAVRPVFPFTAIVGQEEMKLALLLNVVAPSVGGVLITGHRGTGKSTAVRALADLLPPLTAARGCAYNCDPADADALCDDCAALVSNGAGLKRERRVVPVVELPLGATEDRVCGTIDLGRALKDGVKSFEPGLLARANRGFLYIDEVNLLEDHLVDLLLDVAATGRNRVEREGVSAEHPARFVLVGSGNPEEGELRPQLLDRFGLCVEVETEREIESRVRIVEHREAFDRDPASFSSGREGEQARLRRRVLRAAEKYPAVVVPRTLLRQIAELCLRLGVDGHRGEITVARAARALAALEGRGTVSTADIRRVAPMALRHRLRRDPLEQGGGGERVVSAAEEIFGGGEESKSDDALGKRLQHLPKAFGGEVSAPGVPSTDEEDGAEEARRGRRVGLSAKGRGDKNDEAELQVMPPAETRLKAQTPLQGREAVRTLRQAGAATGRRSGARRSVLSPRGRYSGAASSKSVGGHVALDATLRAAAGVRAARSCPVLPSESLVEPDALRFKRFRNKAGTLYIFLVDASGSMALNRIAQAKGALAQLLRRSYVNRDRVALVSFRQGGSELLLAPCASASRALAILNALPVGGATPLASGLLRSLGVARRAAAEGTRQVRLIVFTDGRANLPLSEVVPDRGAARKDQIRREIIALGAAISMTGAAALVVDTQSSFTGGVEGRFLSDALGGSYVRLPQMFSESALA